MKSMFQMGFRNSFFDAPRMGAFPDFSMPQLNIPDIGLPPAAPAAEPAPSPSPSPTPSPTPAPTPEFFPVGWPNYYYPPYPRPIYQVQAPPQPTTTVVKTETAIPPAVYYVGGAALLLGLVALVATR